jgi:hypothetical protein
MVIYFFLYFKEEVFKCKIKNTNFTTQIYMTKLLKMKKMPTNMYFTMELYNNNLNYFQNETIDMRLLEIETKSILNI